MSSDQPGAVIRLMYSPVMERWIFVFGRTLEDASVLTLGDGYGNLGPRSFATTYEARAAAQTCGLLIDDRGIAYADGPDEFLDEAIQEGRIG